MLSGSLPVHLPSRPLLPTAAGRHLLALLPPLLLSISPLLRLPLLPQLGNQLLPLKRPLRRRLPWLGVDVGVSAIRASLSPLSHPCQRVHRGELSADERLSTARLDGASTQQLA